MKKLVVLSFLFTNLSLFAQTWSDDVAQITYSKCSKCHHTGGIAPFPLMNYADVQANATAIQDAITNGIMPPFPPDESYQQYTHSNALTSEQKSIFLTWLTNGMPEGNTSNTPPPPVFSNGSLLGNGDLQVKIPTYRSKAQAGEDDYACFSVPSGLAQDRVIKWIEIIPGNIEIVHHALIYIDPLGVEVTDTIGGDCSSPSNTTTKLIAAYIPGSAPQMMPSQDPLKLGFAMPANSNVYFAMHYPDGSLGQTDSTKVIFHFYPEGETGVREVFAEPIIQNWNFALPVNQNTTVNGSYNAINSDVSILSVFPHMHLLGQTIKSYAVRPTNDTVRFISIPNWDFHWQGFYFFKNIQHLTPNTIIKAQGTYYNSTNAMVYPGLNTSDEMFLVYFHYLPYQTGDENYDLEALMQSEFANVPNLKQERDFGVYPNPFSNTTKIKVNTATKNELVSIAIYNSLGQLVKTICKNSIGITEFNWDGTNEQGNLVQQGLYHVSMNKNGHFSSIPIIKK